ncbi:MAG: CHAT domain-containing protein [Bacteroidota bacterium]|nr:CHAT domain-containing protein [Bacteroidota bacterium]
MAFLQFLPGFEKSADSTAALSFISIARSEMENLQYEKAIVDFNEAGKIWMSLGKGPEYLESQIEIARVFLQIGKNIEAVQTLNSALEKSSILQCDSCGQVGIINGLLGYGYSTLQELSKAEFYAKKGIEQLESFFDYYHERTASGYYTLGTIKKEQGNYDSALSALFRVREIQEKVLGSNNKSFATTLFALGSVFDEKNDFDTALDYYHQALNIYNTIGMSNSANAADCHLYIMSCYNNKGDYRKGIDHGKKTIQIYTSLSLPEHQNIAAAYGKLGEIYTNIGDYEKAKEHLLRALPIFSSRYPEKKTPQGIYRLRLADVYSKTGEYQKAIEYAEKGITIYEQAYGQYHPQAGFMYEQTASVYREVKQFDNALKYFKKAIIARERVNDTLSRNDIAALYSSIADVFVQQNKYDSALINLQRSLAIEQHAKEKNIPQNALLQHRFGNLYFSLQNYQQALLYYQHSIDILTLSDSATDIYAAPLVDNSLYKKELLSSIEQKARTFEKLYGKSRSINDLRAALLLYQTACTVVDDARKQYSGDGSKFFLAEKSASIYRHACRTALTLFEKTKDPIYKEQAFLIADRSKGNILLEKLFDGEAKSFAGIPDSLLNEERELQRSIIFCETQLLHTAEKSNNTDVFSPSEIQTRHFELSRRHQQLIEVLEQHYPKYYELKYARYALSLKQAQKNIAPMSAMVEYMIDDSVIYAFILTNRSLSVRTIRNTSTTGSLVQQFSAALKTYNTEAYCSSGYELYSTLLRPLEKEIASLTSITIIPDGYLFTVPFEALPMQRYSPVQIDFTKLQYVISSRNVTYSYSAAFDLKMNERMNKTVVAELSFAGFAPVFRDSIKNGDFFANRSFVKESGLSDVRSITLDGKKFNELKYSEDEILSIENMFNKHSLHTKNFLHTDATEKNFKEFSRDADIVHVATHGFINEKNPKLSTILFSQPKESNVDDDGILYVDETFNLNLKAQLVVLSSCESGVGKLVDGEGMIALSRGLFYAGAQNIIYSLWKVSDKQTYLLMDEFYKNVVAGRSYSSSLRSAKLSLIASKESAFPSKWSGFVLVGK